MGTFGSEGGSLIFDFLPNKTKRGISERIFASRTFKQLPQRAPACEKLVYYDALRIAYNRVQKNANTTTTSLFSELSGWRFEHHTDAIALSRRLPWKSFSELPGFHSLVVIRSPYSRLLSAFLQKFSFRRVKYVPLYGDFEPTPRGFRSFVSYLARYGLDGNSHWDFQKKQIPFPLDAYDSVIRFESYSSEMARVLRILGISFDKSKLENLFPSDEGKKTDADQRLNSFYNTEAVQAVQDLYSSDFDFLGYPSEF